MTRFLLPLVILTCVTTAGADPHAPGPEVHLGVGRVDEAPLDSRLRTNGANGATLVELGLGVRGRHTYLHLLLGFLYPDQATPPGPSFKKQLRGGLDVGGYVVLERWLRVRAGLFGGAQSSAQSSDGHDLLAPRVALEARLVPGLDLGVVVAADLLPHLGEDRLLLVSLTMNPMLLPL
jgi:hypothetical protein